MKIDIITNLAPVNNRGFFLQRTDAELIWHPFDRPGKKNIVIKKARGMYLYDTQNRKYLDAVSSWWVNVHGHGQQALKNALNKQFSKADHIIFSGFTHEPAIRLAEGLMKRTKGNYNKVFFSDNGSTAVEVALKLSIQYFVQQGAKKITILAFEDAYHGDTFGAMSVGARSMFTQAFDSFMFDVLHLPVPTPGNLPAIRSQIEKAGKESDALVMIYEPLVQGAGGMKMYTAPDLAEVLRTVKQFNAFCIADEVMTGFYRTGTFLASDQINDPNLLPDLVCLSKGITGGVLPLGVTLVREKISHWFAQKEKTEWFYHGHSYTGNPLACAVAVESLKLFDKKKLENIAMIETAHHDFSKKLSNYPQVKNVQVCGTILRFEIEAGEKSNYAHSIRDTIYNYFLDNGILVRPLGNVVYFLPPYIITVKQLAFLYKKTEEFLKTL